jgi:hypothetical protein
MPRPISETRVSGKVEGGGKRWISIRPLRAIDSQINRKATNPVAERKYRFAGVTVSSPPPWPKTERDG